MNRNLAFIATAIFVLLSCQACSGNVFPTGTFFGGDWALEFHADGTFVSAGPSFGSEYGTYTVRGDRVVITDDWCGTVKGSYTWLTWWFFGDNLRFYALDDPCTFRKDIFTGGTWEKR